ncbi:MAG: SurA N-terminal domain-containing protein, partial [Acidobacteria bacterium]|nr:SurA N-terminal domain-containing protein [Acidobacteriota bacterium]
MRNTNSIFLGILLIFIFSFSAFGQETEAVVVDEVVAQVNDSVITLSSINRELKNAIQGIMQQDKKTEAEAKAEVDGKMGQLIANMINEELLFQRGKEMGVEKTVEARINERFLGMMREFNLKSLDELYAAMRSQGVEPDALREEFRKRYTQDEVWRNQVDSVVYWASTEKELKDYYEKNADKFKTPATVTISEIFLSFAGRDKAAVIEKAKQITAQLRGGANFETVAT